VIIKWKGKVYSFSVAWPLILFAFFMVLGPCVLCARLGPQDRAIARIQRLGGKYELDEKAPERPLVKVDLSFSQVTDADVAHLKGLAALEELCLCGTEITDAGLEQLSGLTGLEVLDLWRCKDITDAGLVHLNGMTSLHRLSLWNTEITGDGLRHLGNLTSLRELDLSHTQVTRDGLEHVKKLTGLKRIELVGCENLADADIDDLERALPMLTVTR